MSPFWLGSLAMGFASSGHCSAMCGGIASSAAAVPGARRTFLGFSLNAGRLLTYGAAGALVGGLGSLLDDVSPLRDAVATLRGVLGVLLVGFGLALASGIRSFAFLDRIGAPLWRVLRPYAQRLSGPKTPLRAIAFGAVWGFLPCGLVYAALGVAAASGSPVHGALTMLAFGGGTLPALVLLGSLASGLRTLVAQTPVRLGIGLIVAFSGLVNVASAWPDMSGVRMFAATTHACCHPRRSP
jgi:hypothetical protein